MISKILRLFKHEHNYVFAGISRQGRQYTDIKSGILNPSFWHFPNTETMQNWVDFGYTHAYVYLSHWKCTCGDTKLFFFIYSPFELHAEYTKASISKPVWDLDTHTVEMIKDSNPLTSGNGRSMTVGEFIKKYEPMFGAT